MEETEVPKAVADASKNVIHEISSSSSDLDISANTVKSLVDVANPSNSGGELTDSGESDDVANTSNGNGGKTTSVLKPSPSAGVSGENGSAPSMMEEAWERLRESYVYFKQQLVGTMAANDDPGSANQIFVRDFVPTGLACLMKTDPDVEIVKNFLLETLHLDDSTLGQGMMPASFKVIQDPISKEEVLKADVGGSAIGGVAPVDSGFWWIILLKAYTECTDDDSLAMKPEVQKAITNRCLSDKFNTVPTLSCADGCSMIDRNMGIHDYPIEIQALFFFALRCARQLLKPPHGGKELIERIDKQITALSDHMQKYYWLDLARLNNYKTEEDSDTAVNEVNATPKSIPAWVFKFMPPRGGYFIGNVSPATMDFRWFLVGNCIAILSSLATPAQATAVMDLVEERWTDLIGEMPLKITYPALEGDEWENVTGCDPKNTSWSYHNGGSWPVLLWLLTAASIKTGRPQIAKRAIELVEKRLSKDRWPEYYDVITGCDIGKQARKYQTWSIAGYLVAKLMIENPSNLLIVTLEAKPRLGDVHDDIWINVARWLDAKDILELGRTNSHLNALMNEDIIWKKAFLSKLKMMDQDLDTVRSIYPWKRLYQINFSATNFYDLFFDWQDLNQVVSIESIGGFIIESSKVVLLGGVGVDFEEDIERAVMKELTPMKRGVWIGEVYNLKCPGLHAGDPSYCPHIIKSIHIRHVDFFAKKEFHGRMFQAIDARLSKRKKRRPYSVVAGIFDEEHVKSAKNSKSWEGNALLTRNGIAIREKVGLSDIFHKDLLIFRYDKMCHGEVEAVRLSIFH